jgi:deoxyribose-phosphate aldolase
MSAESIARYIDHTLLKPDAMEADVERLCAEARQYQVAAVCVNPVHVALAARCLRGSSVRVCAVIGFPLGATTSRIKAVEAAQAAADGADELDMVIDIGALKAGDDDRVRADIAAVVAAVPGKVVKVIIETGLLTDAEKVRAAGLVKAAGAHFVKTCTGFAEGGATPHDVALLRKTVGRDFGVKASGKVRDLAAARAVIAAGATRIGTSSSVKIIEEERATGQG